MKYVQKYNIITPKFGGASAPPSTYLSTALQVAGVWRSHWCLYHLWLYTCMHKRLVYKWLCLHAQVLVFVYTSGLIIINCSMWRIEVDRIKVGKNTWPYRATGIQWKWSANEVEMVDSCGLLYACVHACAVCVVWIAMCVWLCVCCACVCACNVCACVCVKEKENVCVVSSKERERESVLCVCCVRDLLKHLCHSR